MTVSNRNLQWTGVREWFKRSITPRQLVRIRCLTRRKPWPRWGNLRRTEPFSSNFGFDRGTPIDRFYLHRFLDRNRRLISGEVLEIQGVMYTRVYGSGIRVAHSIDINPAMNPTYRCDLARPGDTIPPNRYDCFLMPNTLCMLREIEPCLRNALEVVKPGGVILATTASFVPLTPDCPDFWHLSKEGWEEIVARTWRGHDVEIEAHGNCLAATAAMLGLAAEELRPAELEVHDPRYPVLVTVKCTKR